MGACALTPEQVVWHETPFLPWRRPRCWRVLLAWTYNLTVALALHMWLVYVLASRTAMPEQLQASPMGNEEWFASLRFYLSISLVNSFVIVDVAKVLLLTATSTPRADSVLTRSKPVQWLVRKP